MALVRLGTYRSQVEAGVIKAKLQSYGIEAVVDVDLGVAGLPNLEMSQGVRVMVREEDLADAYEVLERMLPAGS